MSNHSVCGHAALGLCQKCWRAREKQEMIEKIRQWEAEEQEDKSRIAQEANASNRRTPKISMPPRIAG